MGAAAILQVASDSETSSRTQPEYADIDFDLGSSSHGGSTSTSSSSSSADSDVDEVQGFFGSTSRGLQRSVEVAGSGFSKRTYGVNLATCYESNSVTDHMHKCAQLDEQLDGLRALLPHSTKGSGRNDDPSVVMEAYRYIVTLEQEVENLSAEVLECEEEIYSRDQERSCKSHDHNKMSDHQPLVEVMKRDGVIEVRIVCANRPRLLVDVMKAVESRGLTVTHARIACHSHDNFVFKYLSLKNEEESATILLSLVGESDSDQADEELNVDSVKAMLMDAICEGSR